MKNSTRRRTSLVNRFLRPLVVARTMGAICCVTAVTAGLAQPPSKSAITTPVDSSSTPQSSMKTLSEAEKATHVQNMRTLAKSIHIRDVNEPQGEPSELIEKPVLAYRDNTRKLFDSTMWIWGRTGRPRAVLAIEFYPQNPDHMKWLYEISSLSTERISAERGQEVGWKAREPGLRFLRLESGAAPASKAATRLAQMRQLRQHFTAYERAPVGGRIELQPLGTPLHRYQDPQGGVVDGAIFAFANGTNPEVLWVIEAQEGPDKNSAWHCAMVQMTGAEVYVEREGKLIWTQPEADPPSTRDSYVNGWLRSHLPRDPDDPQETPPVKLETPPVKK